MRNGSYISVNNWQQFQHYTKRNPPWIKLHRELLRDYDFLCLQDASKLHLMLIWLLASQMDNKIPADPDFIKKQIGVSGEIDFKELINKGFLIDASNALADCNQLAIPETETEAEYTEAESKTEYTCKTAVESYNDLAEVHGLTKVLKMTPQRKTALNLRLKECGGIDGWKQAIAKVADSEFLTGKNSSGWRADFDFIVKPKNFTKIIEGGYSSRKKKSSIDAQMEDILQNGW